MRALTRDRPGRNRENRYPARKLRLLDPISEQAARRLRMRFAQQLPAPDSAAVRKRTSACSETFFPIQCGIARVWANSCRQPGMQDSLHLASYARCEEGLRKRQNRRER